MGLFSLFEKEVHTSENAKDKELKTHLYVNNREEIFDAAINAFKKNEIKVNYIDKERGEIIFGSRGLEGTLTILPMENAKTGVDINVFASGLFSINKPRKLINNLYLELDKNLIRR